MRLFTLSILLSAFTFMSPDFKSQTTAMDFTIVDCNGTGPHNLFSDLNSGKVVIIEYFMTSCSPCITAGQTLESLKANLNAQYPGKIKAYAFGYTNSYSCSTVLNWVNTNSITSVPSDSGAIQVAYYGGMGMPTIVIAGGSNHQLLGSPYIGFAVGDTVQMANDIRNFLNNPAGISESSEPISKTSVYPNPVVSDINIEFSLSTEQKVEIALFDISGRKLLSLYNQETHSGKSKLAFPVKNIAEGNYLLKISSNGYTKTHKLNISR